MSHKRDPGLSETVHLKYVNVSVAKPRAWPQPLYITSLALNPCKISAVYSVAYVGRPTVEGAGEGRVGSPPNHCNSANQKVPLGIV